MVRDRDKGTATNRRHNLEAGTLGALRTAPLHNIPRTLSFKSNAGFLRGLFNA